ncbi:MAG: MFS transporter [Verrucomicrobiota bacterium]
MPELEFSSGNVSPQPVLKTIRRAEYAELIALFFLQGAASGMWLVPLSALLDAHGLQSIKVWAFATNALAAFVSPLLFGGMADRSESPVPVLRGLSFAAAVCAGMVGTAMQFGWNPWLVLALIQATALCLAPAFSLISSIVLARLQFAHWEFGPIRAMATLGWIVGCWVISACHADSSALALYLAATGSLLVCFCAGFVPAQKTLRLAGPLSWHARLGLDALTLLKNRDHRVIFIIVAAFNIPLTAFYPYAPLHIRELGLTRVSAWMSLAQTTEILSMFALGALLHRCRLKWILASGLAIVARWNNPARRLLCLGLYHGPDLCGAARGPWMARAGPGVAQSDVQRVWQPDRLFGVRLVVCCSLAFWRHAMAGLLVRVGGGDGGCPGLFSGRVSRAEGRARGQNDGSINQVRNASASTATIRKKVIFIINYHLRLKCITCKKKVAKDSK